MVTPSLSGYLRPRPSGRKLSPKSLTELNGPEPTRNRRSTKTLALRARKNVWKRAGLECQGHQPRQVGESQRGSEMLLTSDPLWQTTQKHRKHPSVTSVAVLCHGNSPPSPPSLDLLGGNSNSFTTWVLIFPEPLLGERA